MKRNKILGALVGVGGVIATVSTAFAIFVNSPEDIVVDIGTHTSSGDINYTIEDVAIPSSKLQFDGQNSHDFKFKIGATLPEGSLYKQDTVVGNLKVTISGDAVKLLKATDLSITGYAENSYFATHSELNTIVPQVNVETGVITYEMHAAVKNAGQDIAFSISIDDTKVTETALFGGDKVLPGGTYKVDVSWSEQLDTYNSGYLVGTKTNWTNNDEWRMVPDINETAKFQWVIKNVDLAVDDEIKGKKSEPDDTVEGGIRDSWSFNAEDAGGTTGGNYKVTTAGTYTIYWSGTDGDQLYVVNQAA